ncbi:EamA family transporter [Candidatus Woesearchaeota archaeon]|jgi:drug/metabolite transporter (DMT)-like permease|nr:EamA family transporter [Candidatus Woesearchaeota archaeon]MBT6519469.1 EamA family transporter [Candidatus Woesearchaeota archaeon]MBT7368217.1 EamA family transporter [Candidatus Woesearchaeota archaeon]
MTAIIPLYTPIWTILLICVASFFAGLGALLMKMGADEFKLRFIDLIRNKAVLGIGCHGISMLLVLTAFKFGELSVLYPFIALQYVWSSIFSVKYLGEKMNKMKWAGVVVIILSVVLIGFGN